MILSLSSTDQCPGKGPQKQIISWFDFKKRLFERLNLEGGNVASDRIVEDDIVNRHILCRVLNR